MAFTLAKGGPSSTVPMERYIANGAVTKGMPVALTAGASGAELGKVTQLSGGSNASEILYGVAAHTAATTEEVLIIPNHPGQVWVADAVADTNVSNVASDNYLTSTTLTVTASASTVNGRKCNIIGQLGVAGDRKYLVTLGNFGIEAAAPAVATVIAYTLDKSAGAFDSAAVTIFTAPYAMRIDDVIVTGCVTEGSGTAKIFKGTDEICTAIACAVDGNVTHMSAGAVVANKARLVLAAGDLVKTQAAGGTAANIRGIVTVLGHRV